MIHVPFENRMHCMHHDHADARRSIAASPHRRRWTSSAYTNSNLLTGDGEPESVQYALVSSSFFDVRE